ncbi:unnamed protein product [Arabidopsis thaliana]|uniref:(thale cress) hypothetical protein n=1 Tax=Arabidopsis thaliana TaxID=3702 RepID=A0A7G2EW41_ARATH|nr:unnamed protein product [Arabidopsis thaliana]
MACFLNCVRFDVSKTITDKPRSQGSGVTCYNSWDDVETLTSNFSRLIGSGGYSSIYMARFSGSDKAALKVHVSSHRLYQVFRLELDILLRLQHPNIVKLLGYFDDSEENGALLLEYLPQGNLQEKLQSNSKQVLQWRNRVAIALQLVQAIEHIHEKSAPLMNEILDSSVDISEDKVRQFLDPRLLRDSLDIDEVKTMLSVAAVCISSKLSLRPSAAQVADTLIKEIPSLSFLGCGKGV